MFSEAGNDSKLFAVLTECVELVGKGGLQLLTSDIGELSFSYKGFCLGTNELLLEYHNTWAVRLLVLKLRNLIGDFLLA